MKDFDFNLPLDPASMMKPFRRDLIAALVLPEVVRQGSDEEGLANAEDAAQVAVDYADALIAKLDEKKTK